MENSKSNAGLVWTIIVIIVLIIIGAIIWHYNSAPSTAPATTTTAQSGTTGGTGVESGAPMIPYYTLAATSSPTLGSYLIAANGMTLYTYNKDTSAASMCTGACATAWPPYTVSSGVTPTMSTGVTGQVAFITRADGTTQVTYNGKPLYFFTTDTAPGSVTGNNVEGFTVAKP